MPKYETLFLTVPEITADESKNLESELDTVVNDVKGSILSYERWGKYQVAYPVRKNTYGVYFLMRFEIDKDKRDNVIATLKNYFSVKKGDLVMRSIIVKLEDNQSLEYKRPESLEEIPATTEPFFKDHKSKHFKGSEGDAEKHFSPKNENEGLDQDTE